VEIKDIEFALGKLLKTKVCTQEQNYFIITQAHSGTVVMSP